MANKRIFHSISMSATMLKTMRMMMLIPMLMMKFNTILNA